MCCLIGSVLGVLSSLAGAILELRVSIVFNGRVAFFGRLQVHGLPGLVSEDREGLRGLSGRLRQELMSSMCVWP